MISLDHHRDLANKQAQLLAEVARASSSCIHNELVENHTGELPTIQRIDVQPTTLTQAFVSFGARSLRIGDDHT